MAKKIKRLYRAAEGELMTIKNNPEIRLDVPFFKQTTPLNCGPMALKMVLSYFGREEKISVLEARTGIKEGKGISTIQIATAAASLGFRTEFYSKHIGFNEENLKHEFYQEYSDMDLEQSKKCVKDARAMGVNVQEKTLSLEELLGFVKIGGIPIVLLDWNVVGRKEEGYQGHFVPIVGYDEKNVYVHNHGFENSMEFMSIEKTLFDKSRKSSGTDEDVLVIYGK